MQMTFNGYSLNKRFIPLLVSRPSPEIISSTTAIEGRDGEEFDSARYGKREFTIKLVAKEKSQKALQQAARELMGKLLVKQPAEFTFGDEVAVNGSTETQLKRLAMVDGTIDPQEFYRTGAWTVKFVQRDPFLHGKNIAVQFSGTATISVGGNVETYPVATANASGTYQISYKGQHVRFDGAGGRIIVDFRKQKVSSGGATGDGLQVGSRFFALQPGQAKISATHSTQLEYTELWL